MNVLSPQEVACIQMALGVQIEDMEAVIKNPNLPFLPEVRKDMKDILLNSRSALAKIELVSGHNLKLDPYKEGDELEFLTKQS
jgi:hypothetical protein